jgi:hypothetical protein
MEPVVEILVPGAGEPSSFGMELKKNFQAVILIPPTTEWRCKPSSKRSKH